MADLKIKRTTTGWGNSTETTLEMNGADYISESLVKVLFEKTQATEQVQPEKEVTLAELTASTDMKHDVVAIYDNAGIPSIMNKFTRVTNEELFGGSNKVHPAFVIGGKIYDEIYISVYENCEINGKPYSLPMQKPWTSITNDEAAEACFSKGDGWHMLTAAEWGLLANLSLKNGTLPHGNTYYGKYHADEEEQGVTYDGGNKTLTGSGPATWTHDHTPEGVHDLCGNIWEMIRGLRIIDGRLQAAKDNDAALDIDLTRAGNNWQAITDDAGEQIRVSVTDDEEIIFMTSIGIDNYGGCEWKDVKFECESEQLKELALFAGEPEAYCYIDSTDGEYFPYRGGHWGNGANAGVFYARLGAPRSHSSANIGFRSAYFRKTEN
ncbi:MAG: SUMF1/EgtB/PvdO family nonheme iron enzyme [Ruminococcus sp.]|nr:SUMF1/EgtB/PvdO family nonheme iron enzyme [Ruminococcus sp.]